MDGAFTDSGFARDGRQHRSLWVRGQGPQKSHSSIEGPYGDFRGLVFGRC